jgi:diamine N-acetyltransferase
MDGNARRNVGRITIAEVTRTNWRAALILGVAPEQQRFIANSAPIAALALAKAYIRPGGLVWTPYAFFAHDHTVASKTPANGGEDDTMVGFAMLAYEPESADEYWIFHFFIDQRFQGRGYGALALERLLALIRERHPHCQAVQLLVHPENQRAQRLYTRAGFRATGELRDGEPCYRLAW